MSTVVACGVGRSNAWSLGRLRVATCLLVSAFGPCAFALDDEAATAVAQAASPTERSRPQVEVSASLLPRFENTDGSNRTSRIDMTWLPPRRSALGLSLGMGAVDDGMTTSFGPRSGTGTSVDVGLHWRYTMDGNYRVDVTAWRRVMPPDALTLVQTHEPSYGARVEMRITRSPPRNGLVAERGFVGLQLESGARVTLRRSGGKPMIYYRSKF
jgi:hypothetical protein